MLISGPQVFPASLVMARDCVFSFWRIVRAWAFQESLGSSQTPRKRASFTGLRGCGSDPSVVFRLTGVSYRAFPKGKCSSSLLGAEKVTPAPVAQSRQVSQAASSCIVVEAAVFPKARRLVSSV